MKTSKMVDWDIDKVIDSFAEQLKKALNGNAESKYRIGLEFLSGKMFQKDPKQAVCWFGSAADQNHGLSEFELFRLFESGYGVEKNTISALGWLRSSANHGYHLAQYVLGKKHFKGIDVEQSNSMSAYYFSESAKNGNEKAAKQLETIEMCLDNSYKLDKSRISEAQKQKSTDKKRVNIGEFADQTRYTNLDGSVKYADSVNNTKCVS